MKITDEEIRKHLSKGGKIIYPMLRQPLYIDKLDGILTYTSKNGMKYVYNLSLADLESNDWEIVPKAYNYDKIIADKILCVFWNDGYEDCLNITTLKGISENGHFIDKNNSLYDNCTIFNPADFVIAQNAEDYEL